MSAMDVKQENVPYAAEQRDAALAKLREILGGEPDPEMLALVRERDEEIAARLAANAA